MPSDAIDDGWVKWRKQKILICQVIRLIASALMGSTPNYPRKKHDAQVQGLAAVADLVGGWMMCEELELTQIHGFFRIPISHCIP